MMNEIKSLPCADEPADDVYNCVCEFHNSGTWFYFLSFDLFDDAMRFQNYSLKKPWLPLSLCSVSWIRELILHVVVAMLSINSHIGCSLCTKNILIIEKCRNYEKGIRSLCRYSQYGCWKRMLWSLVFTADSGNYPEQC